MLVRVWKGFKLSGNDGGDDDDNGKLLEHFAIIQISNLDYQLESKKAAHSPTKDVQVCDCVFSLLFTERDGGKKRGG